MDIDWGLLIGIIAFNTLIIGIIWGAR